MKDLKIIMLFVLTLFTPILLQAQDNLLDSEKITLETGKKIFDKEGNERQVQNSPTLKGYSIKKGEKWVKHGVFLRYYSSGKLQSKTTYSYGIKEGQHISYFSNGEKKFEYNNKNDKPDGTHLQYNDEGTIVREIEYKNGEKNGPDTSYHRNGKVKGTCTNVNDKWQGEYIAYNDKGKKLYKSIYKNGKQVGKSEYY